MKVKRREGGDERLVLTGMIVDTSVVARVASVWKKEGLFKSTWSNQVAKWCLRYYQRHGKAPRAHVENMFRNWAEEQSDDATVTLVEKFLNQLNNNYKQVKKELNPDYVIDVAGRLFNRNALQMLHEALENDLDGNAIEDAMKRINQFGHVEIGVGAGVDPFNDKEAIKAAFQHESDVLLTYPGALGKFLGDIFERDGFVCFTAPEKRGKSFWLMDVAWRAMLQRRTVAFFAVGDMSQNQMIRRFQARAAKHPIRPGLVKYPTSISRDKREQQATVEFEEREYKKGLTWQQGFEARKAIEQQIKSTRKFLNLICAPASTMSVPSIESTLDVWERVHQWIPDIVIIDYADILAPPAGVPESREAINATWKLMRSLSQKKHCCVVTATQADAASYTSSIITASNFSEDKRKWSHVTAALGINATPEEKEQQIYRLNFVQRREDDFDPRRCIHVASCLAYANPAVRSTY